MPTEGGLATGTEKRIYRLSAACAVLAGLALIVPRFVHNQEGGFAAGAGAVLVLLAFLVAAAIVSLYALWVTARAYREIRLSARIAGIGPSIVLVGALVLLMGFLRY